MPQSIFLTLLSLEKFNVLHLIILTTLLTKTIVGQYMESPCPNIFQYRYNQAFGWYGEINFSNPGGQMVQLNLELSVGNVVEGGNGNIELASTSKQEVIDDIMNGRPIRYRVMFPTWRNIPPQVTKILVNGRLICSGPKLTVSQVPVVTTINLQHTLRIGVQPLNFNGDASVQNIPNLDFNTQSRPVSQWNAGNQPSRPDFQVFVNSNNNNFNINRIPPNDISNGNNNFVNNQPVNTDISASISKNPFFATSTGIGSKPSVQAFDIFTNRITPRPQTSRPRPNLAPVNAVSRPNLQSNINSEASSPAKFDNVCGLSLHTNNLVVYGDSVAKGAYPWLAALFTVTQLGLNYTCSGSLISEQHVVTAAHCVFDGVRTLKPRKLIVMLGRLNLQKWTTSREERNIEAEAIHVHPDYRTLNGDADIAMIVLSETVTFSNHIRPLCLWRGSNNLDAVVGMEGTVVGWGRDEEGNPMTSEAKQTKLPIVSQEQCLRSSQQFLYITSNRTFCAGFRDGSGPCNGDSGSGFIVKINGRWTLRGIVSMSLATQTRACDLKNYVVFTDASKFITWMTNFFE